MAVTEPRGLTDEFQVFRISWSLQKGFTIIKTEDGGAFNKVDYRGVKHLPRLTTEGEIFTMVKDAAAGFPLL